MTATRLTRSCAVAGCPAAADRGGRCSAHTVAHRRTVNIDQHHRLYRQAQWLRLRTQVIADYPFCQDCHVRLSQEVHHAVHRELNPENFYDRSLLRALCRPCHATRTRRGE